MHHERKSDIFGCMSPQDFSLSFMSIEPKDFARRALPRHGSRVSRQPNRSAAGRTSAPQKEDEDSIYRSAGVDIHSSRAPRGQRRDRDGSRRRRLPRPRFARGRTRHVALSHGLLRRSQHDLGDGARRRNLRHAIPNHYGSFTDRALCGRRHDRRSQTAMGRDRGSAGAGEPSPSARHGVRHSCGRYARLSRCDFGTARRRDREHPLALQNGRSGDDRSHRSGNEATGLQDLGDMHLVDWFFIDRRSLVVWRKFWMSSRNRGLPSK